MSRRRPHTLPHPYSTHIPPPYPTPVPHPRAPPYPQAAREGLHQTELFKKRVAAKLEEERQRAAAREEAIVAQKSQLLEACFSHEPILPICHTPLFPYLTDFFLLLKALARERQAVMQVRVQRAPK